MSNASLKKFIFDGVILYISGWELVVLHTTPSMFGKFVVHAWWYRGGLNEEHSTSGQTHFGVTRGAKLSLTLNEPN